MSGLLTKKRLFWLFMAGLAAMVFLLNMQQINQQGTYRNIFLPIAESLIEGNGYQCDFLPGSELTYPLWGYTYATLLATVLGDGLLLLAFQFILLLAAIHYFYKMYGISPERWHITFFIPFVALMSVKWPDAWAGAMIIFYVYNNIQFIKSGRWLNLLWAGLWLGLILNFRSEYLYLPAVNAVMLVLPRFRPWIKRVLLSSVVTGALASLCMLPWAMHSNEVSGHYNISATNGGAVMYLSLGQLPGNPWGIEPYDPSAFEFAARHGIDNPYSYDADTLFKSEVKRLVLAEPLAFAQKCGYNLISSLRRGVYTGEFGNHRMGWQRRMELDSAMSEAGGAFAQIAYLFSLDYTEWVPIVTEKVIQLFFIVVFALLLLIMLHRHFRDSDSAGPLHLCIGAAVVYKFVIISLIQYEYRHMNAIYLFVLGIALYNFSDYKRLLELLKNKIGFAKK